MCWAGFYGNGTDPRSLQKNNSITKEPQLLRIIPRVAALIMLCSYGRRRHGGEAGGDELLELGALDGQHGLACGAQDLVDEGQSQHSGAGEGGSGDGAGGDMCVHGMSFLPARPGGQS